MNTEPNNANATTMLPESNGRRNFPSVELPEGSVGTPTCELPDWADTESGTVDEILSRTPTVPLDLISMDLTKLAVKSIGAAPAATKYLTTLRVGKPPKSAFVRTRADSECWNPFALIELKEQQKFYLLGTEVAEELARDGEATLIYAALVPAVDRDGNLFIWILKCSDRENDWHISARRAAEMAKTKWVRCYADQASGCYQTLVAEDQGCHPQWPKETYAEMLEIAFRGRVIMDRNHSLLRKLRGEA